MTPARRLMLKRSTGWFAAGEELAAALGLLSEAAFKLYVYLCLNVDRHSGRMIWEALDLANRLQRDRESVALALEELCRLQQPVGVHERRVVDAAFPHREPLGSCAASDHVERGRRHPAFVGAEMMLDAEAVVEAELVAELKLAPELLVALMRGHVGLAPDMGEVSEFHERSFHCGREHRVSAEPTGARRPRHRGGSFSMPV